MNWMLFLQLELSEVEFNSQAQAWAPGRLGGNTTNIQLDLSIVDGVQHCVSLSLFFDNKAIHTHREKKICE